MQKDNYEKLNGLYNNILKMSPKVKVSELEGLERDAYAELMEIDVFLAGIVTSTLRSKSTDKIDKYKNALSTVFEKFDKYGFSKESELVKYRTQQRAIVQLLLNMVSTGVKRRA